MKGRIANVLKTIGIIIFVGIFAIVGAGIGTLWGIAKGLPDVAEIELMPTDNYTSFICDKNGVEFDRLSSGEDRIYATLPQIPIHLQEAVIATEDERFYQHTGIDIKGILRALVANIKSGEFSQGASTITQQVVKNNVLTSEKKIVRKIQEQYLAIQFERFYKKKYGEKEGKDLILEYYLNTMPLGRGTNGVQAAANRYFGKDVSALTLAESVVLAGITQAPTRFDPIKNPENNYDKAQIILQKMVDQGYITAEEQQQALKENPYKVVYEANQVYQQTSTHSYFVDALIDEVLQDLQIVKGLTDTQASKLLFEGGIKIYATFDRQMQSIVDGYMADDSLYPQKDYELKLAYTVSVRKEDDTLANLYAEGIVK
ncbi:MAG: transglycosylase domain-containing protein, partial [Cellulosilyticaceae bacterium]